MVFVISVTVNKSDSGSFAINILIKFYFWKMFITIISSYSRRVLTVNSKILSHSSKIRNMHLLQNKAYVNGKWVSSGSNTCFDVVNPATEEIVGSAPDMDVADTQKAIDAAHTAFYNPKWQNLTAKDRSGLLKVSINIRFIII